ncbi:MAG: hypothetical protein ACSLFM_14860 [Tepidiformaceae bacterium]
MDKLRARASRVWCYWGVWWQRVWKDLDKRWQIMSGLFVLVLGGLIFAGVAISNDAITVASASVLACLVLWHLVADTAELWTDERTQNDELRAKLETQPPRFDANRVRFRLNFVDLSGLRADRSENEAIRMEYRIANYSGAQLELTGATISGQMRVGNDLEARLPILETGGTVADGQAREILIKQGTPSLADALFRKGMAGNEIFVIQLEQLSINCRAVLSDGRTEDVSIGINDDARIGIIGPIQGDADYGVLRRPAFTLGSGRFYDADGRPTSRVAEADAGGDGQPAPRPQPPDRSQVAGTIRTFPPRIWSTPAVAKDGQQVTFTTEGGEAHMPLPRRPISIRVLEPHEEILRAAQLPAEMPTPNGRVVVRRFTEDGIDFDERDVVGVRVTLEVYYELENNLRLNSNLSLKVIPSDDNPTVAMVDWETQGRRGVGISLGKRPTFLRDQERNRTIREADLPASILCGDGEVVVVRFYDDGFAVDEIGTDGDRIRLSYG